MFTGVYYISVQRRERKSEMRLFKKKREGRIDPTRRPSIYVVSTIPSACSLSAVSINGQKNATKDRQRPNFPFNRRVV